MLEDTTVVCGAIGNKSLDLYECTMLVLEAVEVTSQDTIAVPFLGCDVDFHLDFLSKFILSSDNHPDVAVNVTLTIRSESVWCGDKVRLGYISESVH